MITRNSVKCVHCGVEVVSTHRHDFNPHYCTVKKRAALEWYTDEAGKERLREKVPFEQTYNFAVDGGNEYLRRIGDPEDMIDTSITSGRPAD